jgi:hypothetical protein
VDRHVEKVLEEAERRGLPRFQTSVEVVAMTSQDALERFFGGVDLECGPVPGGAPTEMEMRAVRVRPSPYADFLALGRVLAEKLKRGNRGAASFFLYRVRRQDQVSYLVRHARVPAEWVTGINGATFELVETFADAEGATRAWRRMERGFATPVRTTSASPPPPWVTTSCRPPGR